MQKKSRSGEIYRSSSLRKGALFKFNNMKKKKQVIVYVDGYNFYYGLRNGGARWKCLYWLDIVKFFERMMLADQELVEKIGNESWYIEKIGGGDGKNPSTAPLT